MSILLPRISLCMLFSMSLLTSCTVPQPDNSGDSPAAAARVWPAPPAVARIAFVREISTPQALQIKKSLLRRFLDRFAGRSELKFIRPSGVSARDGVLFVADPGTRSVWILDPANKRVTKVHKAGESLLLSPVAVAVRGDGGVFVADSAAATVFSFDQRGNYLGNIAKGKLQRPAGLAYDDRSDHLYIADSAAHRIFVYDADGRALFSWGKRGVGEGEFNFPTHVAIAGSGEVLVTDALNFRVQSFSQNGKFLWQFGRHGDSSGSFSAPKGVAVDSRQHVYVVDALFDAIQLFQADGTFLLSFGSHGNGPGEFWLPGGLFVDADDHIYVADAYNHRIQEFRLLPQAQPISPDNQP